MEQKNTQEPDAKIFSNLIYNPSAISASDTNVLADLVDKYPYAQLLRSFYARSLVDSHSTTFENALTKAALFSSDGAILRTIIEEPESIKNKRREPDFISEEDTQVSDALSGAEEMIKVENAVHTPDAIHDLESPTFAEFEEFASDPTYSVTEEMEDGSYEELISDFLKQDVAAGPSLDITEDVFTPEADIAEKISHNAVIPDQQKVSRYDDDKLPYSFLWWLTKTRKEHADSYQPYVSFRLDTNQNIKKNTVDQLSTQIIENIFHLQSPVDELENAPKTVPFQVKRKEDVIIEKFIREEPQIKPPKSDKLDNENKARKSAEDPNDLVSETLAHIYTDQMLFHKAIETYKKLSLKFPEKSTYFADQIRELEKKIN